MELSVNSIQTIRVSKLLYSERIEYEATTMVRIDQGL
jgi:hypothetical protein